MSNGSSETFRCSTCIGDTLPTAEALVKYRGGVGAESAFTIHNCREDKIKVVAMGVAGLRNSGQGDFWRLSRRARNIGAL